MKCAGRRGEGGSAEADAWSVGSAGLVVDAQLRAPLSAARWSYLSGQARMRHRGEKVQPYMIPDSERSFQIKKLMRVADTWLTMLNE